MVVHVWVYVSGDFNIREFVITSWNVHLLERLTYELHVVLVITVSSVCVTFRRFVCLCLDLIGC